MVDIRIMEDTDGPIVVQLPKIVDVRGNLSYIEKGVGFPFEVRRVFWTFNVPGGASRGGHAYRTQNELIVSVSGAFNVATVNQLGQRKNFRLDRGDFGLFLPPLVWRWMDGFSTNAVGLHVSDSDFVESDYIREMGQFLDKSWARDCEE